ncbi:MAG: hypothetical protein ACOYKN_09930 [Pirellula sp.]
MWDSFPVSPGHLLLIPQRHTPTWCHCTGATSPHGCLNKNR